MFSQPSYTLFREAYAERKAPLVIVCGSGLSAPAKLPTWPKLLKTLIQESNNKYHAQGTIGQEILRPKLDAIKRQKDYWVAFKLIKEFLGKPLFDSLVERELTPSGEIPIPETYLQLLRLQLDGLVTLNLDKFAGEALAQTQSVPITPVYGTEIAKKWNQIRAAKTYLVYIHGGLHDPSTWVMTQDDLDGIAKSEGHSLFLKSIFLDNLVLFVGVSADDIALSGRLMQLTTSGFRPKNLYWLSTRSGEAEAWAESASVKIISYQAKSDQEHTDVIRSIVDDLVKFRAVDKIQMPLVREETFAPIDAHIPDPEALAQLHPEEIRTSVSTILNNRLVKASLVSEEEMLKEYRLFCDEYDFAVDRAFYKGKAEKFRTWFGYKLDAAPLGRGNFGEVYGAISPNGDLVAVKIMNKGIFRNDDMLAGFRRGVRSMNIVTQQSVEGMVPIIESYELPPTIVMPYVGGVSLQDAMKPENGVSWLTKLDIAISVGRIVSRGHALPQTVLHRDLKPSNIMISNMEYKGSFHPEVIVLDFDMSWHKGSKEKDVVFESRDDFGYLAPEQTDKSNRFSARSTRVDSYGLGMTLFFMFGQEPPRPNEALSELWQKRATRALANGYVHGWKSAPNRLGRLVARATAIEQSLRVDFATMTHELEFVKQAVTAPESLENPELWAEEVMAHIGGNTDYDWDDAIGKGVITRPSGIKIEVTTGFRNGSIMLAIGFTETGFGERSKLSKYLGNAIDVADRAFRETEWHILERSSGLREAFIKAEIKADVLQAERERAFSGAERALRAFQL